MTKLSLLSICFLFSFSILSAQPIKIGEKVPDFEAKEWLWTPDQPLGMGKPILLYFNSNPPMSLASMVIPITQMATAYKGELDVVSLYASRQRSKLKKFFAQSASMQYTDPKLFYMGVATPTFSYRFSYLRSGTVFLIDQKGILQWFGDPNQLKIPIMQTFLETGVVNIPPSPQTRLNKHEAFAQSFRRANLSNPKIEWKKLEQTDSPRFVANSNSVEYYNMTFKEIMEEEFFMKKLFNNFSPKAYTDTSRYYLTIDNIIGYRDELIENNQIYDKQSLKKVMFESIKANIAPTLTVDHKKKNFQYLNLRDLDKLAQYKTQVYPFTDSPLPSEIQNDTLYLTNVKLDHIADELISVFPNDHVEFLRTEDAFNTKYDIAIPIQSVEQCMQFMEQALGMTHSNPNYTSSFYLWSSEKPNANTVYDISNRKLYELTQVEHISPEYTPRIKPYRKQLKMEGQSIDFKIKDWINEIGVNQGLSPFDYNQPLIITFLDLTSVSSFHTNCLNYVRTPLYDLAFYFDGKVSFIVVDTNDTLQTTFLKLAKRSNHLSFPNYPSRQLKNHKQRITYTNPRSTRASIYWAQDHSFPWFKGEKPQNGISYVFNSDGALQWQGNLSLLSLRAVDEIIKTGNCYQQSEPIPSDYRFCEESYPKRNLSPKIIIKPIDPLHVKHKKTGGIPSRELEYYGFTLQEMLTDLLPKIDYYPYGGFIVQDDFGDQQLHALAQDLPNKKDTLIHELRSQFGIQFMLDSIELETWVISIADSAMLKKQMTYAAGRGNKGSKNLFSCNNCEMQSLAETLIDCTDAQAVAWLPDTQYKLRIKFETLEELQEKLRTEAGIQINKKKLFWPIIKVGRQLPEDQQIDWRIAKQFWEQMNDYKNRPEDERQLLPGNIYLKRECQIQIQPAGTIEEYQSPRIFRYRDQQYRDKSLKDIVCRLKRWPMFRVVLEEGLENIKLDILAICDRKNLEEEISKSLFDQYQLGHRDIVASHKVQVLHIKNDSLFQNAIDKAPQYGDPKQADDGTWINLDGQAFINFISGFTKSMVVCDTTLDQRYQLKLRPFSNPSAIKQDLEQNYGLILIEEEREVPLIEIFQKQ